MKSAMYFFIICIIITSTGSCGQAQNNASDKRPEEMLKEFYTNYMNMMAEGPYDRQFEDSLKQKYCTKAFLKKLPGILEEADADPFIAAQDVNIGSANTLVIKENLQKQNQYTVTYTDPYSHDDYVINLTVVKEKDGYKIDAVW